MQLQMYSMCIQLLAQYAPLLIQLFVTLWLLFLLAYVILLFIL